MAKGSVGKTESSADSGGWGGELCGEFGCPIVGHLADLKQSADNIQGARQTLSSRDRTRWVTAIIIAAVPLFVYVTITLHDVETLREAVQGHITRSDELRKEITALKVLNAQLLSDLNHLSQICAEHRRRDNID